MMMTRPSDPRHHHRNYRNSERIPAIIVWTLSSEYGTHETTRPNSGLGLQMTEVVPFSLGNGFTAGAWQSVGFRIETLVIYKLLQIYYTERSVKY